MEAIANAIRAPIMAPEADRPALLALEAALAEQASGVNAHLIGVQGECLDMPPSVRTLLKQAIHDLVQGRAVSIAPIEQELTTQQAAELLSVSRPFLVKLLEAGAMPFHKAGTHRRVFLQDVFEYLKRRSVVRQAYFARATREAQEMGIYE